MGQHRLKLKKGGSAYYTMQVICQSQLEIFKAVQSLPKALKQRYLLVRYEDLVRDPLGQTAQCMNRGGWEFCPGSGLGYMASLEARA